jgi:hypothetical protein
MRSLGQKLIVLLICIASYVLADVEIDSVHLIWHGCTNPQKSIINNAWDDAIAMAKRAYTTLNFNEAAAIEFFGRASVEDDIKSRIGEVLKKASTYDRGTWSPVDWNFNVHCDDQSSCNTRVSAFTRNLDSNGNIVPGKDKTTPHIYFCSNFFELSSLADIIDENKKREVNFKFDLIRYQHSAGRRITH